jgi:hypothetical protein
MIPLSSVSFLLVALAVHTTHAFAQPAVSLHHPQQVYTYNNQQDTIRFTTIVPGANLCYFNAPALIDSIQLDGTGAKELIFFRKCTCTISKHGGTFDINEKIEASKYEIWNTDTKTLLFEARNYFRSSYSRSHPVQFPGSVKGTEMYRYRFTISSNGVITIGQPQITVKATSYQWKTIIRRGKSKSVVKKQRYHYLFSPDKVPGNYSWRNGNYVRTETNNQL